MPEEPTGKVTVRMYDVGFGDCFLLSFGYRDADDRHVMIDCGTIKGADRLDQSVRQLRDDCRLQSTGQPKLQAMVFTHRHADHISGFGSKARTKILRSLDPDVILLGWTEDPGARRDATKPDPKYTAADREYVAQLAAAHDFAELLDNNPADLKPYGYDATLTNAQALDVLAELSDKCRYLCAGQEGVLEDVLPGVQVTVLAPPTLEQWPGLGQHMAPEEKEYWENEKAFAQLRLGQRPDPARELPRLKGTEMSLRRASSVTRYFVNRLERQRGWHMMRLVRTLDAELNNTSLVLLFEVGEVKLLFPGDAEPNSWDFVFSDKGAGVPKDLDLLKIGHHGSANATPRAQLWDQLENLSEDEDAPGRLVTMLSTKDGCWDTIPAWELREAVRQKTHLLSTYEKDQQGGPWVIELPRG